MGKNKSLTRKDLLGFYANGIEEDRGNQPRSGSMEFHYTEKLLHNYVNPNSKVIELGCATGYYAMRFADLCAEYVSVDVVPEHIAVFRQKINQSQKHNIQALVGDATDLSEIPSSSFDVVLCLGPMYHLPPKQREAVMKECYRIGRTQAVFAFAYINRLGVYAGACVHDQLRDKYPNPRANRYVLEQSRDDVWPEVFFYTSPEEMEQNVKENGFQVIGNYGLDFFFMASAIDAMNEEQFRCYLELADKMSNSPFCTGLANHALLLCCKEEGKNREGDR